MLGLASTWTTDEKPNPGEALKAFEAYQKHAHNPSIAERYRVKIEKALGIQSVIIHAEKGKIAPMLAPVEFSRTHFRSSNKLYREVRQKVDKLIVLTSTRETLAAPAEPFFCAMDSMGRRQGPRLSEPTLP